MAEEALLKALSNLNIQQQNREIVLRQQETAINNLLDGRDMMAILPTGYEKSMIFTVYVLAKQELSSMRMCVFVFQHTVNLRWLPGVFTNDHA